MPCHCPEAHQAYRLIQQAFVIPIRMAPSVLQELILILRNIPEGGKRIGNHAFRYRFGIDVVAAQDPDPPFKHGKRRQLCHRPAGVGDDLQSVCLLKNRLAEPRRAPAGDQHGNARNLFFQSVSCRSESFQITSPSVSRRAAVSGGRKVSRMCPFGMVTKSFSITVPPSICCRSNCK